MSSRDADTVTVNAAAQTFLEQDACGDIAAYVAALLASERLGRQVVYHRVFPAAPPAYADPLRPFSRPVAAMLAGRGITRLYTHQAAAVDLARAGRHVAVATPTASGKTMTYLLPVLEEIAHMAAIAHRLNVNVEPAPQSVMDKHYFRKHGANAYYGQGDHT